MARNLKFHYGSENIAIAGEYKYLGVLFKPSGVFSHAIKLLSDKAMKAIFCIRKQLAFDRLYVLQHIKLFETCGRLFCFIVVDVVVRENIDVENRYKINIPEKILIKFSIMVLGVNRSAVNPAVLAELGLLPLSVCALKFNVGFWLHLLQSDENNIAIKHILIVLI